MSFENINHLSGTAPKFLVGGGGTLKGNGKSRYQTPDEGLKDFLSGGSETGADYKRRSWQDDNC